MLKKETVAAYKKRAAELVAQMTLQEKVFQMLYAAPAIDRLGIKGYNWWNEALHGVARAGVATVFPQAIGLAAAFDRELMEEVADAIATEARAKYNMQQAAGDTDIYKGLTFWTPNVNIFRDPRWGRGHETYGEDPYLTGKLGVSFVTGLQGHDETYMKAAACAKHYAVHSGPESQRHSFDAVVSKRDMAETYLPAFKACVTEGAVEAVMGAYNRTNGEPCCGSKTLLLDILRGEWGFDGHVVSDCWAVKDFHDFHKVTNTPVESVALAVNNGCDLNCGNMFVYLLEAVEQGLVEEGDINKAVIRLMTTRMKLGMLESPEKTPFKDIPYTVVDSSQMRDLNLRAARESLVLLKNKEHILPFNKDNLKTLAVIGPNANNRKALEGNYVGTASRYITVLEGIQDFLEGSGVRVLFSEGCHLYKDNVSGLSRPGDRLAEAAAVCGLADAVVVCVGLDTRLEGEEGDQGNEFSSGDKGRLELPGLQDELIKLACASGKPVAVVNLSGSAVALTAADETAGAIIQGWYPGAQGGRAVAELLFGAAEPSGKLPVTFYKTTAELPDFTDYAMAGRTYRYMKNPALYPFGYGLTYGDYEITGVKADSGLISDTGASISLTIKNTSKRPLTETLQAYVRFEDGDSLTPNWQLKDFRKIRLTPGETQDVRIMLPIKAFALAGDDGVFQVSPGSYTVYIGCSQPDERSAALTGKNLSQIKLRAETALTL